MQMLKYREFLDESEKKELRDIFIEMRAKEIFKNLSLYDFMTDKYQKEVRDINLIADSLKMKNFFPSFDIESPNAELLVFYKWIVLNEKIKFDGQIKLLKKEASKEKDKQKKDVINKNITDQTEFFENCTKQLFCNFRERGKKDAIEYSPDEAVTLYRELIRLMQCDQSRKSYFIPYSQIVDMKVPKIVVELSTGGILAGGLAGAVMLSKGGGALGSIFGPIGSGIGMGIGATGGFVAGVFTEAAGEMIMNKKWQFSSAEVEKMSEYLDLMNLLLKVCIGKYYTEEEKRDACFV